MEYSNTNTYTNINNNLYLHSTKYKKSNISSNPNKTQEFTCKKWECVKDNEDGYNKATVICCDRCNNYSAYLYKLHLSDDEPGSYYCDCGKDINLYYLCFRCKNKRITDA